MAAKFSSQITGKSTAYSTICWGWHPKKQSAMLGLSPDKNTMTEIMPLRHLVGLWGRLDSSGQNIFERSELVYSGISIFNFGINLFMCKQMMQIILLSPSNFCIDFPSSMKTFDIWNCFVMCITDYTLDSTKSWPCHFWNAVTLSVASSWCPQGTRIFLCYSSLSSIILE